MIPDFTHFLELRRLGASLLHHEFPAFMDLSRADQEKALDSISNRMADRGRRGDYWPESADDLMRDELCKAFRAALDSLHLGGMKGLEEFQDQGLREAVTEEALSEEQARYLGWHDEASS